MKALIFIAYLCLVEAKFYDVTTIYRLAQFPVAVHAPATRDVAASDDNCVAGLPDYLCSWEKKGWSLTDSGLSTVIFPSTVSGELASEANNFTAKMMLTTAVYDLFVQRTKQATFIFSTEESYANADLILLQIKTKVESDPIKASYDFNNDDILITVAYRCLVGQKGETITLTDGLERKCDVISERTVRNWKLPAVKQYRLHVEPSRLSIAQVDMETSPIFDLQQINQLEDLKYLQVVADGNLTRPTTVFSLDEKQGSLVSPSMRHRGSPLVCVALTVYLDPRSGASVAVTAEYDDGRKLKLGVVTASTFNHVMPRGSSQGNSLSWKFAKFVDPSDTTPYKIHVRVDKLHDFPVLISDATFCQEDVQLEVHARTNARGLPFILSNGTRIEPNFGNNIPPCNTHNSNCNWSMENLSWAPAQYDEPLTSINDEPRPFTGVLYARLDGLVVDYEEDEEWTVGILLYRDMNAFYYITLVDKETPGEIEVIIRKCWNSWRNNNLHVLGHGNFECDYASSGKVQRQNFPNLNGNIFTGLDIEVTVKDGRIICIVKGDTVVDWEDSTPYTVRDFKFVTANLNGAFAIFPDPHLALKLTAETGALVSPTVALTSSKLCVALEYYTDTDNSTVEVTLVTAEDDVTLEPTSRDVKNVIGYNEEGLKVRRRDLVILQVPSEYLPRSVRVKVSAKKGSKESQLKLLRVAGCNAEEAEDVTIFPVNEKIQNESPGFDVAANDRTTGLGTISCYHGGRESNSSAECVCPAGFYGSYCESGCGANSYGADCGGRCSSTDRECRGMILCRPLLGCACAPGLQGALCDKPCMDGYYGAECKQTCGRCHVDMSTGEETCDKFTGECLQGCQPGFFAPLCKEKYAHLRSIPVAGYQGDTFGISIDLGTRNGKGNPQFFKVQTRIKKSSSLAPHLPYVANVTADVTNSEMYAWTSTTPELLSTANSDASDRIWRNISGLQSDSDPDRIWRKISGLKPGRQYELRVVMIDQDGGIYEGNDVPVINIRTNCTTPKHVEYNLQSVNITAHSFAIKWNDVSDLDDSCPVEWYELRVLIDWRWLVQKYDPNTSHGVFHGLLPGTKYSVTVAAVSVAGAFPSSNTLIVVTKHADVMNRVGGLSVGPEALSHQLEIYWRPPSDSVETAVLQYDVLYECLHLLAYPDVDCTSSFGHLETTNTSIVLPGLLSFARYNITVSALSASVGIPSSIQAATDDAAPTVPPQLSRQPVLNRTNSSFAVQWDPPNNVTRINGYLIGYHCEVTKPGRSAPLAEKATITTDAEFKDLEPHEEYTVKVYAKSSSGWNKDYPLTFSVKTRATTPDAVQNLTVYKRGRRMLGVRWGKPLMTYGSLRSFTVTYRPHGDAVADAVAGSVTVEAQPCPAWPQLYCHTLNNLNQDQVYRITVQARNSEVDEGGEVAAVKGTTKEGTPAAPPYLRWRNLTTTSVTIEWGLPELINGQLRSFLLTVEQTDSANASDCCENFPMREIVVSTEESNYQFQLSALKPASTYMISVTGKTVSLGQSVGLSVNTRPPTPTLVTAPKLVSSVGPGEKIRVVMEPTESYQDMISGYLLLLASNKTGGARIHTNDTWLAEKLNAISPTLFLAAEFTKAKPLRAAETVEIVGGAAETSGRLGVVWVPTLPADTYQLVQVLVLDYCRSLSLGYIQGDTFTVPPQ